MSKRILQEIVVGGLSGLAVVLLYILIRAIADGTQSGDWLQFAGAMLGTAVAVGGALFVESHKRRQDDEKGQATLLDAISEIEYAVRSFAEPLEGDLTRKISQINSRRYLLEVAKEFTDFVLTQHVYPSSRVWRSARGFGQHMDRMLDVKWYVRDQLAGDDVCGDDSVDRWYKATSKLALMLLPILRQEMANMKDRPDRLSIDPPGAIEG